MEFRHGEGRSLMAFNAHTYRMNQHRKSAWRYLAEAREIKSRAARGEAYGWETPRITLNVMLARSEMKLHLMCREMRKDGLA